MTVLGRIGAAAAAVGIGTALALASPLAAIAHVSVTPAEAEPGAYAQLTFRVPNESDTAGTVRLEVTLPEDTPFASVSYQPVAGWTTTVTTTPLPEPVEVAGNELTEAVTTIVWEAQPGSQIAPGQFQLFPISVGPVPEVGSVTLPAVQTYSDGTVAEWTGGPDAEYPAPVLYVEDAPVDAHGHGEEESAADPEATSAVTTAAPDPVARGVAIAGLGLGALALVLATFGLLRRRSAPRS